MIKVLISDFWHVLLFPKDFQSRGSSKMVRQLMNAKGTSAFFGEYFLNEELLYFYAEIKQIHHLKLIVYSSGTLFKKPELQPFLTPVFDQSFSAADSGYAKDNPSTFHYLAKEMKVKTTELLFVDDRNENLKAAQITGAVTVRYHDNEQAMTDIQELLTR